MKPHRLGPRALASLALFLALAGCSLGEPPAPPEAPPETPAPPHSQGAQLYEDAVAALLASRHTTALAWFSDLANTAGDPALKRRARYGQAAAALAAARTPQTAAQAQDLWRAWQQEAPPVQDQEDPRLLAPALAGLEACLAARPTPEGREGFQQLKQRLAKMQEENQRLKKQLADLEALHKELTERKSRLGR